MKLLYHMGLGLSIAKTSRKINFEDMQWCILNQPNIIISTLKIEKQGCLIAGTISASEETDIINKYLQTDSSIRIIIYGENASDDTIIAKYTQLTGLGFSNVYIYPGGMFEWLLLQDIYGTDLFKTMGSEVDILKYKGSRHLGVLMLQ